MMGFSVDFTISVTTVRCFTTWIESSLIALKEGHESRVHGDVAQRTNLGVGKCGEQSLLLIGF